MARPALTVVKLYTSSLEDAHRIIGRLTDAGFARNSMEIERDDDEFVVELHCREGNRARARRIANGSFAMGSPATVAALSVGALAVVVGIVVALAARRAVPAYAARGQGEPSPMRQG